jgi:hypothetical protein
VVRVSRIECETFPGAFRTRILEVNLRGLVFSCVRIGFRAMSDQEEVPGDGGFSSSRGRRVWTMGKDTCVVDIREVRMVGFRRCAPVSQI